MTTVHITKSLLPAPPPPSHAKDAASSKGLEMQAYCGHKTTKNPFEVKICWNIRFQLL